MLILQLYVIWWEDNKIVKNGRTSLSAFIIIYILDKNIFEVTTYNKTIY